MAKAVGRRSRSSMKVYLYALSATCLIAVGLIAACMLLEVQEGGGLGFASVARSDEWTVLEEEAGNATNGTDLGHVPECANDEHCRGACRMICSEIQWNIGAENHAATLLSFGCCEGAPLMQKQVVDDARDMMLDEVVARAFPRIRHGGGRGLKQAPAGTSGGFLSDQHSLEADMAQLQAQERAMQLRVKKLPLRQMLARNYKARKYSNDKSKAIPGTTSGSMAQRKPTDRKHDTTADDPYGVERQNKKKRNNNQGSSEASLYRRRRYKEDPHEEDSRMKKKKQERSLEREQGKGTKIDHYGHQMQGVTRYGTPGTFKGGNEFFADRRRKATYSAKDRRRVFSERSKYKYEAYPGMYGKRGYNDEYNSEARESYIREYGVPTIHDRKTHDPSDSWRHDAYLNFKWCLDHQDEPKCLEELFADREGWEWRVKDECRYPVHSTVKAEWGPVSSNDTCIEMVPAHIERTYGHDVARGLLTPADLEDELMGHEPTDQGVEHFLGRELYKDYMREKAENNFFGPMHVRMREGQARLGKAYAFEKAYNTSEFEWCLAHHANDADFPKACIDKEDWLGKPYQSRNKPTTAPEDVLNGVVSGWANLLGDDRHEKTVDHDEVAGIKHPNQFENGVFAVPPNSVMGMAAPFERMKGFRDEAQHPEQKAREARDLRKLPGVTLDSWTGAVPMTYSFSNHHPMAVTPHKCCASFVENSDLE